jgi:hypothetical protein
VLVVAHIVLMLGSFIRLVGNRNVVDGLGMGEEAV